MSDAEFPLHQQWVANQLGVGEDRVVALRPAVLEEGVDWRKEGRRNVYALSAVEKMRAALSIPAVEAGPERMGDGQSAMGDKPEGNETERSLEAVDVIEEAAAGEQTEVCATPVQTFGTGTELEKAGARMRLWRVQVLKIWTNPRYVGGVVVPGGILPAPGVRITNAIGDGFEAIPADADRLTLLRVRVKTSMNLVRGMVVPCVHISEDLYEAVQLPRTKGRW